MLTGTAMTSAIAETTTVPNENASVPNVRVAGSQTSLGEVVEALARNAGQAFAIVEYGDERQDHQDQSAAPTNATPRKTRSTSRPGGRSPPSCGGRGLDGDGREVDGHEDERVARAGPRRPPHAG